VSSAGAVRFEGPGGDGVGRIVIDRPDDAVNAVDARLVDDLGAAVRAARACDGLLGVVVASGKPGQFVAGADLKMITSATDARQIETASRRFQAVLDELAWLPCTTVAAITGPALGAGLELALACDYRVALDAASVSLGQPEVNLGLVPAGGGTQRLPRLVGLRRGLELILSGRRLNPTRARRAGLVDEVVHPSVLDRAARAWALEAKRPLDRPVKLGLSLQAAADVAEQTPAGRQLMYRQARASIMARTHGHYPAPLRALEAVERGFERGMAVGLEAESAAFRDLAVTPATRNLIWLFMATQRQKRLALPVGPAREVDRMAVVGAGFMGAAIAEVGAAAGLPVRVRDVKPEAVARGLASIRRLVAEGVARRRFQPREGRDILQRVSGTTDYSGFGTADLVIEAVFEDLEVKRGIVRDLEAVVSAETVIASNTSALPIAQIASGSRHPERVVGMHFFSPAQRMPLLEVVRPVAAADWAVASAVALGIRMGKTVIVVGDSAGFYTSRVLGVMMNEATLLLGEGARVEDVDRALTEFGFPVGPFVLYDEVGLEVAQHVGDGLERAFGGRFPPSSVVRQLVAAGQTGRRVGTGFYLWPSPDPIPAMLRRLVKRGGRVPNPAVYAGADAPARRDFERQTIQDRLVLLFVAEAIRCLDEGVLQSPTDGDLGAVLGLGFPAFRGGPFHYADALGLAALADRLRALAARHGVRYEPAAGLVERAREARPFFEE
jgi:3-hydroxyacyl-CoA dehydrogenase / enoyl-CoA hydratase / 3-hydroxybutyryl-CoA epimerase